MKRFRSHVRLKSDYIFKGKQLNLLPVVTGFPAVRENLEKGLFLEKVRENLEKSGNFCKIPQKSWKSQGISLKNALNLVVLFSKIFLSDPTMVGPPNYYCNH